MKNKNLIIPLLFLFVISFIAATPQITIHSPQNITYDSTKILVNVTSDEPVDFFIRNERTGRKIILAENTTSLEDYLYVKEGNYEFTTWANNSNGESNDSVVFSDSVHNPIYITSCGTLYSPDAEYAVINDLIPTPTTRTCLSIWNLRNVSINLNNHIIHRGTHQAVILSYSSDINLFNGTINGSPTRTSFTSGLIDAEGTKLRFSDLFMNGNIAFSIFNLDNSIFENIRINSSVGFWHYAVTNTYFIDSSFNWNGFSGVNELETAFYDQSDHSTIFLENTTIEGFPEYDFYSRGTYTDYFLRNSNLNISRIKFPDSIADIRVFTQHLITINVTDQFNKTGSGVIEILDDGTFERKIGLDALTDTLANPTSQLLVATNKDGTAEIWVTEKLTYAKSSSPPVITEYDFSLYNITAKTWDTDQTITLNLTGHQSTIPLSFKLEVPGVEELPACTITHMLDLNNDGFVSIQDAIIMLRVITGLPVSVNGEKECKGISLYIP